MFTRTIFYTIFLTLILLATRPTFASPSATIVVNSSGDTTANDGACTLREAIVNANENDQSGSTDCAAGNGADTITFGSNLNGTTIILTEPQTSNQKFLHVNDDLTINGLGETNLTISGNDDTHIFAISHDSLTITDLTLENGRQESHGSIGGCIRGGLLHSGGPALTLTNVTLQNCNAVSSAFSARGGAIFAGEGSTLTFTNVTFNNNVAYAFSATVPDEGFAEGGALYAIESTLLFDNVTATGNRASAYSHDVNGGAFALKDVTLTWTDGTVVENVAESRFRTNVAGGGISIIGNSVVDITDVTVQANEAKSFNNFPTFGGGIGVNAIPDEDDTLHTVQLTLNDSRIENNEVGYANLSHVNGKGGGIYLASSDNTFVTLDGTDVIYNSAENGGGVYIEQIDPVCRKLPIMTGGVVQNNYAAEKGGGVAIVGADGCTVEIAYTIFSSNRADDGGGGVHVASHHATLQNVSVSLNRATDGTGGGLLNDGTAWLRGATVQFNVAESNNNGGGIANYNTLQIEANSRILNNSGNAGAGIFSTVVSGTVSISDSTIQNNNGSSGAGMYLASGTATIDTTTFHNNTASLLGGGLLTLSSTNDPLVVTNSTFSDNSANTGGGLFYGDGDTGYVANTTFSGNSASADGSGVFIGLGRLRLHNATVANGTGSSGLTNTNGTLTVINSIVAHNAGDECDGTISSGVLPNMATDGTCGNAMVADPLLDTLEDNGGSTKTMALLEGSPAINAGFDDTCNDFPVNGVDQRGVSRSADVRCDLGAYEVASVPTAVTLQEVTTDSSPSILRLIVPTIIFITLFFILWLRRINE